MVTIDKWTAEQCGVVINTSVFEQVQPSTWRHHNTTYAGKWTIKDPQCRIKFWQWWLSSDSKRRLVLTGQYVSCSELCGIDIAVNIIPGIDSDDAEIACIIAIYEAERLAEES